MDTRNKNNYSDFLQCMHLQYCIHEYKKVNLFHYDTELDNIYMKIRFHCSQLKADQYKYNFIPNSKCTECNKNKQETIHHYFMVCTKYIHQRKLLKQNISNMSPYFQNLSNRQLISIVEGHKNPDIDTNIYKNIYQFIKLYIATTGRFAA